MIYTKEIFYLIRGVLCAIRDNAGIISHDFLNGEVSFIEDNSPVDATQVINVALVALGGTPAWDVRITDEQMTSLVKRATADNGDLIYEIALVRAA